MHVGGVISTSGVNKGQKKMSDPLKLELQEVGRPMIGELGFELWSSVRAAKALSC